MRGGGRIWAVNTTHSVGPAGFHTYELDLTTGYKVLIRPSFLYYYFMTGEDNKAVFLFSATQLLPEISVLIERAAALFQSSTPLFKAHPSVKVLKPLNILKVLV
jgi:hypothetical protein